MFCLLLCSVLYTKYVKSTAVCPLTLVGLGLSQPSLASECAPPHSWALAD
jgi:hypothetical protein